jgi:hypothetical protein
MLAQTATSKNATKHPDFFICRNLTQPSRASQEQQCDRMDGILRQEDRIGRNHRMAVLGTPSTSVQQQLAHSPNPSRYFGFVAMSVGSPLMDPAKSRARS